MLIEPQHLGMAIALRTGLLKAACSALRSSPCIHATVPTASTTCITRSADETTVVGLITDSEKVDHRKKASVPAMTTG